MPDDLSAMSFFFHLKIFKLTLKARIKTAADDSLEYFFIVCF